MVWPYFLPSAHSVSLQCFFLKSVAATLYTHFKTKVIQKMNQIREPNICMTCSSEYLKDSSFLFCRFFYFLLNIDLYLNVILHRTLWLEGKISLIFLL